VGHPQVVPGDDGDGGDDDGGANEMVMMMTLARMLVAGVLWLGLHEGCGKRLLIGPTCSQLWRWLCCCVCCFVRLLLSTVSIWVKAQMPYPTP
jgi:hypothetical protein